MCPIQINIQITLKLFTDAVDNGHALIFVYSAEQQGLIK